MLLFLNIDCVLAVPSDATGPQHDGATGIRRLETVLETWPQWRVVITSERRYRMTLEHFRRFFGPRLRPRLVGTTPPYQPLDRGRGHTREQEVMDYLAREAHPGIDWLALDDRASEYPAHAARLVCCQTLTEEAETRLHAVLMRRAVQRESVVHWTVARAAGAPHWFSRPMTSSAAA